MRIYKLSLYTVKSVHILYVSHIQHDYYRITISFIRVLLP